MPDIGVTKRLLVVSRLMLSRGRSRMEQRSTITEHLPHSWPGRGVQLAQRSYRPLQSRTSMTVGKGTLRPSTPNVMQAMLEGMVKAT